MSDETQTPERAKPKTRWLILGAAVTFAALACAAAALVLIFARSNTALAIGSLTVAGISLEVLMWTAAGVFGWGFLAKRREALKRWRDRMFGAKPRDGEHA